MYKNLIKPFFDHLCAGLALLLLSPLFLLVTIAVTIANNGKPFFIQKRPGKNGRLFNIIKFKTMNDKKDPQGNLLPDAQRLTAVGKIVRKTSLDEIPQLINVIRGCVDVVEDKHSFALKSKNLKQFAKVMLICMKKSGLIKEIKERQKSIGQILTDKTFITEKKVNIISFY